MPLGEHCNLWSMRKPDSFFCNQSYIIMTNVHTEIENLSVTVGRHCGECCYKGRSCVLQQ